MNSIVQLLSNTGYIMYNKTIAKALGSNEAILIGELCSKYQYWLDKGDLMANDGWFYVTRKQIAEDTSLTDNQQRSALQNLKDNAIIEAQRKGTPSQMWYKLNVEELDDLMCENRTTSSMKSRPLDVRKVDDLMCEKCTTSGLESRRLVVGKVDDIYMYNKKDSKKDNKKDNKKNATTEDKPTKKFIPPLLAEVQAYCLERRNDVDPKKFIDYFSASEWVDSAGKPVRNWKQKIITWEGSRKPATTSNPFLKKLQEAENEPNRDL